jgi:hypothetical protein
LCYDIRDVPDAVNESLVIFKVMFTYMAVGGAIFAVLLAMTIDHFSEEVVLASAYFICIFATYYFYFWPKMSLLLQGADLDKNFQIVRLRATCVRFRLLLLTLPLRCRASCRCSQRRRRKTNRQRTKNLRW